MSIDNQTMIHHLHMAGVDDIRKRSGWILAFGVLVIILGAVALASSVVVTLASMIFLGWLMILTGVLQIAHAFSIKAWGGFFIDLLAGVLYGVIGFMFIAHPAIAAATVTLLIASLLIVGGIFRIIVAIAVRFPNSGWLILHGLVNIVLGAAIIQQWPLSGLQVIGIFIGIDMIFTGWTLVMLAIAVRRLTRPTA